MRNQFENEVGVTFLILETEKLVIVAWTADGLGKKCLELSIDNPQPLNYKKGSKNEKIEGAADA